MRSTSISSSVGVWFFLYFWVTVKRQLLHWWMTLNSIIDKCSCKLPSLPVASIRLKIHCSVSWSVLTVSEQPSSRAGAATLPAPLRDTRNWRYRRHTTRHLATQVNIRLVRSFNCPNFAEGYIQSTGLVCGIPLYKRLTDVEDPAQRIPPIYISTSPRWLFRAVVILQRFPVEV